MDSSDGMANADEVSDSKEVSDTVEISDSDYAYPEMVYPFTRAEFLKSYLKQSFPLPDSLMYYIVRNLPNPEMYEKLIQTCKNFFITNPIIVVSSFKHHYESGFIEEEDEDIAWHTALNGKYVNLDEISSKLWITKEIDIIIHWYHGSQQQVASLFTRIYRSDAKKCELREIDISFKDFMLITPKCEEMKLTTVTVIYGDGSVVPLEKLVEAVPHLTSFFYYIPEEDADVAKIVTSTTVKNLLQIPLFSTLKNFTLYFVPEVFDIQRFFAYIKENKTIHVELGYDSEVSKEYATSIEAIIQEIIQTKDCDYDVPWFYFSAMDGDLYDGLRAICNRCS